MVESFKSTNNILWIIYCNMTKIVNFQLNNQFRLICLGTLRIVKTCDLLLNLIFNHLVRVDILFKIFKT